MVAVTLQISWTVTGRPPLTLLILLLTELYNILTSAVNREVVPCKNVQGYQPGVLFSLNFVTILDDRLFNMR